MKYIPTYIYDLKVGDTFVENVDIQDQIMYEVTAIENTDSVFDKVFYKSLNTGISYNKEVWEFEKVLKIELT